MRSQLTVPQRHAIALLAACKPLPDVARACCACEATVRRWKKIPEFQAAVTAKARRRMEVAGRAFDRRAAKAIEAAMHAQRELHAYIRGKKELPFQRVLELRRTMEDGARMLDRIRFSSKAKNRHELLMFMRPAKYFAAASANHCDDEVSKKGETLETPQKSPIFGHAYGARVHAPKRQFRCRGCKSL